MAFVTTNTNLTAVTYVEGEDIVIQRGATLTVNSTPAIRPGNIICNTSGRLLVTNSSTTTPILLPLSDWTKDFVFSNDGRMEVLGEMIEVATSNGASFSWTVATPDLTYVEAERVAGSGIYFPILIASSDARFTTGGRPTQRGCLAADFESNYLVCLYDQTANSATIGLNGGFLPTGCRVRTPNILIGNLDWNKAATNTHSLITEGGPTAGQFQIEIFNPRTATVLGVTAAIPFNATAAAIDTAIEAITGVNTITSGGGPLPTAVTLTHALGIANTPLEFRITGSTLSGGTNPVAYDREQSDGNGTLLSTNLGGDFVMTRGMLGSKVKVSPSNQGVFSMTQSGTGCNTLSLANSPANITLDRVVNTRNPFVLPANFQLSGCTGVINVDQLLILQDTLASGWSINSGNLNTWNRVETYMPRRTTTNQNCTMSQVVVANPMLDNLVIGGTAVYQNMSNFSVIRMRHSDRTQAGSLTTVGQVALSLQNVTNVVFGDFRSVGTAAARNGVVNANQNCDNVAFYGMDYNLQNNTTSPFIYSGNRGIAVDINFRNNPSTLGFQQTGAYLSRGLSILRGQQFTSANTLSMLPANGGQYDLVAVSPITNAIVSSGTLNLENYPGGNFVLASATASPATTGALVFGTYNPGTGSVLTGSGYYVGNGTVQLNAGDVVINTLGFPCRGITAFTGGSLVFGNWFGGIGVNHTIRNLGGITGGTFTVSVFDAANTLLGTTPAQPFNVSAATLQTAIRAIVGVNAGATVTGTSLALGFSLGMVNNNRVAIDGALLTGGATPAQAEAIFNAGSTGVPYTQIGPFHTAEFRWKLNSSASYSAWNLITSANLTAAVLGGSSGSEGINVELRLVALAGVPVSAVQNTFTGILLNTTVNPALAATASGTVNIRGNASGDTYQIRQASNDALLYSFTAAGVQGFDVGSNFGLSVYMTRTNSSGVVLVNKKPEPWTIRYGDNGIQDMFYGTQVQVATTGVVSGPTDLTPVLTAVSGVSTQVTNVQTGVTNVNSAVSGVATQVTGVQTGVNTANTGITNLGTSVSNVSTQVTGVQTGVTATNTTLASNLAVSTTALNARLVTIEGYTDTLEALVASLPQAFLDKDLQISGSSGRTVRQALQATRNRVALAGSTLTVYNEDDTTVAWTAQVTLAARDAFQQVDPA